MFDIIRGARFNLQIEFENYNYYNITYKSMDSKIDDEDLFADLENGARSVLMPDDPILNLEAYREDMTGILREIEANFDEINRARINEIYPQISKDDIVYRI
jgi:hypothetical protein